MKPTSRKPASKASPEDISAIVSKEVESALHVAFVSARQRRHEFITIEHLLFQLLEVPSTKTILLACGADIDDLRSKIGVFIDEYVPVKEGTDEVDTQPTLGFQRVV